ncbi:MAG: single-stranded-DNA-specific exonuclease RecJ [Rhodospirillales bacterium]|nr:single-stranded-DNA-specific exonuclease RecJ [Rhodospirillales bacterium]
MAAVTESEAAGAAFLGVEESFGGKRWEERLTDSRLGLALAQRLGASEVLGRVLAARGIGPDEVEDFLDPTLKRLLPDPSCLRDMDLAAERFAQAIMTGESVAVFGDYDVDGATSAALLQRFATAVGGDLTVYIPDRLSEGYGPNWPALRRLREEGAGLIITVDCGISAFEPLEAAAGAGLEVIVVDHHSAEARLPPAYAVVNPNRLDDDSGLGHLAAVGVAFLLAVATNRTLRRAGWYAKAGHSEPDLLSWLDLAGLGTVCDVVPLRGLNRAFVVQGLKVLAQGRNAGLTALREAAGVSRPPDGYQLGYVLGPRVNAGGRVGEAPLGARLLASDDPRAAAEIAARLDRFNAERREIEAAVLDQAIELVEHGGGAPGALVFASSEGWHPGVIGIVASRLKERYNRPALVIALEGEQGKGSGRSVPGVDLGASVLVARQAGLLLNGGGHPMAAGLTVARAALEDLRAFLEERIAAQIRESGYRPSMRLDGAVQIGGANAALVDELDRCAPFGAANAAPRFAIPGVRVIKPRVVGKDHVSCILTGPGGARLRAIAFRALDSELGRRLLHAGSMPLHVAGKLERDTWTGGEAVQVIIEDAAAVPV